MHNPSFGSQAVLAMAFSVFTHTLLFYCTDEPDSHIGLIANFVKDKVTRL